MSLTINTNIASLNAQRNLGKTQGTLNKSLERLSSGLRINSAKDDAAGLAISNRMNAQIRGLNQAARNANDGISLGQTAEGALQETTNLLQRMRELAIQSANDTNSSDDRASIQAEVTQLISELDRIATGTQFNGKNLLDGTMGIASFHIGANANQTISMTISSARAAELGARATGSSDVSQTATVTEVEQAGTPITQTTTNYTGVSATAITADDLSINGTDIDATTAEDAAAGKTTGSAYAKVVAINSSSVDGVTATASTTKTFTHLGTGLFLDNNIAVDAAGDNLAVYTLTINGDDVFTQSFTNGTADITIDDIVSSINNNTGDTGVVASKDGSNDLVLTAADGRDIIIKDSYNYTQGTNDTVDVIGSVFSTFTTVNGTDETGVNSSQQAWGGSVTLSSNSDISFGGGVGASLLGRSGGISINLSDNISTIDVSTVSAANSAIETIDAALSSVDSSRASLGAAQNRFESTIANLQNISENLSAARSRILDADFAAETAALTKAQILQQAGVAMLAQANQLPQTVLSLLQ
ncbi:flagellin [bacterium]|nr:flagellin [bacterium]